MNEYEGARRVAYGDDDSGSMVFVPVCERCGRFVKADATVTYGSTQEGGEANATCSRCGRVHMLFEGWL